MYPTSVGVKPIQSLYQTAVKTKESAAFSDNLAVFRIRRCARRCTSALFTGAGISTPKSICRRALRRHHAAVIVSNIYNNYSFHHFWFAKKQWIPHLGFCSFFLLLEKNPWMLHCGYNVDSQHFQRLNSNVLSKGFLIVSQGFLLIFWWEDADVYSCSQFTDDHNLTDWKQGSDCF